MSFKVKNEWRLELRELWNQFDPIGVISETCVAIDSEYDSYHRMTLKHLNDGSDSYKFFMAIKHVITVNIGMTWNEKLEEGTHLFVSLVMEWFETKIPDTKK
jgi:hypothetical protein